MSLLPAMIGPQAAHHQDRRKGIRKKVAYITPLLIILSYLFSLYLDTMFVPSHHIAFARVISASAPGAGRALLTDLRGPG